MPSRGLTAKHDDSITALGGGGGGGGAAAGATIFAATTAAGSMWPPLLHGDGDSSGVSASVSGLQIPASATPSTPIPPLPTYDDDDDDDGDDNRSSSSGGGGNNAGRR